MSTTTESKFSLADELTETHNSYIEEADELLREIVSEGRQPSYAELTFFKQRCGWDESAIGEHRRRMASVLSFKAIAGTLADRQASTKEAETASKLLESEGPKLRTKIETLQAQLDGLERDARLSSKRCEEQAEAVEKLRSLCPEHISQKVNHDVAAIKNSIGRELGDAEVRLNELQCLLTPSKYKSERDWLECLERSFRDAVDRVGNPFKRRLSSAWPGIRSEMERELSELEAKVAELRPQLAEALEAARQPLDYYAG